jgi:hypothetical protein
MLSAYATALPSSSVLPGGSVPIVSVDGTVVALALVCASTLLVAVIVARRQRRGADAPPSRHAIERGAMPPSRNLTAA